MAYSQHVHQLKKLTALPPNDVQQLMLDTRWADVCLLIPLGLLSH
jgi:hypothetical protein